MTTDSSRTSWYIGVALAAILACGAFVRLDDFADRLRFNNDQVRDTNIVTDMLREGDMPLLGPKAGGTLFRLGPAFYYVLAASGAIFGATPEGIAFVVPLLSVATLACLYVLLRHCFTPRLALSLTALAAVSFFLVKYGRFVWNPNIIPFVLTIHMIALLRTLESSRTAPQWGWWAALALSTGMGMQLHTSLLFILPAMIATLHGINRFVDRQALPLAQLVVTGAFICASLFPMALFDIRNNGENIRAFLTGSAEKISLTSMTKNIVHVGQFFSQGSVYVLSGTEPTRDWMAPRKLLANPEQLALALLGVAVCAAGIFATVYALRHSTDERRTRFLRAVLSIVVLHILFLVPIGDDLRTRFFLTLFFVPFVWIGLLYEITQRVQSAGARVALHYASCAVMVFLVVCNLRAYTTAYAFDAGVDNDIYGGVSLGELREIADAMAQATPGQDVVYVLPHNYGRSLRAAAAYRDDLNLTTATITEVPAGATVFFFSEKKNAVPPAAVRACTQQNDHRIIRRWHLIVLRKIHDNCAAEETAR